MTKGIYEALSQYEEVGGDMVERIKSFSLTEVFQPLIDAYASGADADLSKFNLALFYILRTYSATSKHVHPDMAWIENKYLIARELKLDEYDSQWCNDMVNMTIPKVVATVANYVDIQNSEEYLHYLMLKEVYHQLTMSAMGDIRDKDGLVNYDQKKKNANSASELRKEIFEFGQNMTTTSNGNAAKEVKEKRATNKPTLRLEDVIYSFNSSEAKARELVEQAKKQEKEEKKRNKKGKKDEEEDDEDEDI